MNASKNKIILAVAGAGKTTELAKQALAKARQTDKKILLITYTINGVNSLLNTIKQNNLGVINHNIEIMSWYKFLLNECILPYQRDFNININIKGILFTNEVPKKNNLPVYTFKNKTDMARYVTLSKKAYSDTMSDFLIQINKINNGLFVKRLEDVYSDIFIDEVQDLNGEDLEIIEELLKSNINICLIGDHRQSTFNTHSSQKYKRYKGSNIKEFFKIWENSGLVNIEEKLECHRSIQDICSFADMLYPKESKAKSLNKVKTELDGVFLIKQEDIIDFNNMLHPFVLRWDKRENTCGLNATNFGDSKALTKERTLIFPTKPMIDFYLDNKTIDSDVSKYYVALTRAKQSICIVVDKFPQRDFLEDYNFREINLKKFVLTNKED